VDLAPPDGTFRVVAWNVSSGRFRGEAEAFQRVLAALRPDVVLLDEVFEDVTDADLQAFFDNVPTALLDRRWQWWIAEGGGPQRTVVASSAFEVRGEPRLAQIPYPEGSLARWASEAGDTRATRARADLERAAGLSATGAWIDIEGLPILFVPVDFQSGGYAGSPQDRLRVLQAETLNAALTEILADRREAGLVAGGDMNIVGSDRPLRALVRGLDAGRDVSVVRALNGPDRSLVTWRSLGNADLFSPGRLDYVLYRGSRLEEAKAFVLDAGYLLEDDRQALGVTASDTDVASDHLPVVADFRIRR
jgi:endonuclease/exonuclease/phosphatase family metal-dependent hydrolase